VTATMADDDCPRTSAVLGAFYQVERAGVIGLSDGGGPFGFDITVALIVDDLMRRYECDAIIETGCFLGDTTCYLARRYQDIPVYSCDIDPGYAAFARRRLAGYGNVQVTHEDSPDLVARASARHVRPFFFLDAHWREVWPLSRELEQISHGVVAIHDFDIGHPRFSYDEYDGIVCGPRVLAAMASPPEFYFTPDVDTVPALPCLQMGRRAGVGFIAVGLDTGSLQAGIGLRRRHLDVVSAVTS
jgi:SAM-dependent methyltransferase